MWKDLPFVYLSYSRWSRASPLASPKSWKYIHLENCLVETGPYVACLFKWVELGSYRDVNPGVKLFWSSICNFGFISIHVSKKYHVGRQYFILMFVTLFLLMCWTQPCIIKQDPGMTNVKFSPGKVISLFLLPKNFLRQGVLFYLDVWENYKAFKKY